MPTPPRSTLSLPALTTPNTSPNSTPGLVRGYTNLTYRYAYEFNGTFMPDYMGHNATDNARFAAALRHVILLNKNRCTQAGVKRKVLLQPHQHQLVPDTDCMLRISREMMSSTSLIRISTTTPISAGPCRMWDANGNFVGHLCA